MEVLTCYNCGSLFNRDYVMEYRKPEKDCDTYADKFKDFFACPVCKEESIAIETKFKELI